MLLMVLTDHLKCTGPLLLNARETMVSKTASTYFTKSRPFTQRNRKRTNEWMDKRRKVYSNIRAKKIKILSLVVSVKSSNHHPIILPMEQNT